MAKNPRSLARMTISVSGLTPPVYIDTKGTRVVQSRLQRNESSYPDAKLAFYAKESPIWTRVRVFGLVSSQPISLAHVQHAGRPRTP